MALTDVNIVIIGGGIAGAGLAANLLADPKKAINVHLLEQESRAGYHSTGRSAAIYIESYGNKTIRTLNRLSLPFFNQPEGIEGGSLLRSRGMLLSAKTADLSAVDELLDESAAVNEISLSAARELVPVLDTDKVDRIVYEKDASDIDVDRLHQGWLRQASARGAQIKLDAQVTAIEREQGAWVVCCGSQRYNADIVVNAAGAWADQVAQLAGVSPKSLVPHRRSAAMVQLSNPVAVSDWPLFAEINETWYAKPETNRLMVSPADEDPVPAGDAWVDDLVLAEGIDRFESAITETVARVEHRWAGLRTFAPDHTPVVGFDHAADSFFWLAGHGGYGIQTSPALSRFAADLVLGRAVDNELRDQLCPMRDMHPVAPQLAPSSA